MRCCVPNCFNKSNKTNKSQGITFHKMPKNPDHSAAWLEAITRLGYRKKNKCLLVCSEHFLPEDFNHNMPIQRRPKSGAVPTIMAPVIQDFKMCRVCLALDVKMYDMKNYKLSEMFQNITGILAIDNKGSILQRVCWECAARLSAAAAFRDKALLSDTLLKDFVHIKKSKIATLKRKHTSLKSPLTVHSTFTSSDIEYEFSISENEGKDILPNDEIDVKARNTKNRIVKEEKEMEFEDEDKKPWIVAPMKTDRESDPLAAMDILIQDRKSDTFLELTHSDDGITSVKEDSNYEIRNTKVKINNNNTILRDNTQNKIPILINGKIVLADDPKLDMVKVIKEEESSIVLADDPKLVMVKVIKEEESSGPEDSQSTPEVSVSKPKQKNSSNEKETVRKYNISDQLKEKILSMKEFGVSNSEIAKETGLTVSFIICLWDCYRTINGKPRRFTTVRRNKSVRPFTNGDGDGVRKMTKITRHNNTSTLSEQEQSCKEGANSEMSLQTPAILTEIFIEDNSRPMWDAYSSVQT